jgi:hypothetical protein
MTVASNFLGTEFSAQGAGLGPGAPAAELAAVLYRPNVLGMRGPRQVTVVVPTLSGRADRAAPRAAPTPLDTLLARCASATRRSSIKHPNRQPYRQHTTPPPHTPPPLQRDWHCAPYKAKGRVAEKGSRGCGRGAWGRQQPSRMPRPRQLQRCATQPPLECPAARPPGPPCLLQVQAVRAARLRGPAQQGTALERGSAGLLPQLWRARDAPLGQKLPAGIGRQRGANGW